MYFLHCPIHFHLDQALSSLPILVQNEHHGIRSRPVASLPVASSDLPLPCPESHILVIIREKIQEPHLFDDGKNTCQTYWTHWTNKALLLDLHLNQSPPAWPSWPLWAILIEYNGEVEPPKNWQHSRESELGFPGHSDIFKCQFIQIHSMIGWS